MNSKKRVAIVGTNGIPARYGGYETLAEYLTKYLAGEFDFTIYCSNTQPQKQKFFNGSRLLHVPLKANGWQSIFYDFFTLVHASFYSDVILYLGPSVGFAVPFLKFLNKRIIVNHGGLNEWEREKYSSFQRFIAKMGHKYAAKFADYNIADNFHLRESIIKIFNKESLVIRYGGDHAVKVKINSELLIKYPFLSHDYFVNVSRAQVDNNLHLVLESFRTSIDKTLVMVSNWSISKYGLELKKEYKDRYPHIIILDAVYEQEEIDAIRGNAKVYIHSHSYCGTSPSLVEAMSLGLPIFSFDVLTNRETTQNKAFYFKNEKDLHDLIKLQKKEDLSLNGKVMKQIADMDYTWSSISSSYAVLFR